MSELRSVSVAPNLDAASAGAAVGDYVQILKPRVMSLVVFTGVVGLVLAPGHLHPFLAAVAILCIAIGAGASGATIAAAKRIKDLRGRCSRSRSRICH